MKRAGQHSSVGRAFACGAIGLHLNPTNAQSQVHGRDQLSCHAGYQEVSRCHTKGESKGMCNTYASAKCE